MRPLLRLFRPRLALLNGIAALGGYLLFPAPPEMVALGALVSGVTLLAVGGSALNQVIERDLDRLMVRTSSRPLPRGDLTPTAATLLGSAAILAGLATLAAAVGVLPSLLGGAALAWYLAVYTPLKRRTTLSLAVGAVCGAVPPVIGWCAAGGDPSDYRAILLAGILYLWQIPHFWLFQRRHADDYWTAGIPLLGAGREGANLCRLWLVALSAAVLLLPALGMAGGHAAPWLAAFPLIFVGLSFRIPERALFACLNLFPLLVPLVLVLP
jgi:protoheme IX farnesyltransferase